MEAFDFATPYLMSNDKNTFNTDPKSSVLKLRRVFTAPHVLLLNEKQKKKATSKQRDLISLFRFYYVDI